MLSERLVELEREGLVAKYACGSRAEYSLTASARELEFMLAKLDRWWSARQPFSQLMIAKLAEP